MSDKQVRSAGETKVRAKQLWQQFDQNQKTGIRFCMFPMKEMAVVEEEGYNSKDICVELMTCAKKDGGMRA